MKAYWAHQTAEVSPQAKIGKGTKIWQNSQILANAEIGNDCIVGHNCLISGRAHIGQGVKIESNVDVWDLITLQDHVFVGPSVVFTNDPNPRAKYPKKNYPLYGKWLPTLIKEGASLGANATIICGITIGKNALVGAGSVISKNIPNYALVVGNPAKQIGWICECGNKIKFKTNKTKCPICRRGYIKKNNIVKETKMERK